MSRPTTQEAIADALNDPILAAQAAEIRSIRRDLDALVQKAAAIMAERERTKQSLDNLGQRFLDTLEMEDFENCILAHSRAMAVGEIGQRYFRILVARAEGDSIPERIWAGRYPHRDTLALEVINKVHSALKLALVKSENDDSKAAASVFLRRADSSLTEALRSRVSSTGVRASFLSVARVIEELFPETT